MLPESLGHSPWSLSSSRCRTRRCCQRGRGPRSWSGSRSLSNTATGSWSRSCSAWSSTVCGPVRRKFYYVCYSKDKRFKGNNGSVKASSSRYLSCGKINKIQNESFFSGQAGCWTTLVKVILYNLFIPERCQRNAVNFDQNFDPLW